MTEALIDADLVAFRCAASAEGEELWIALSRVDELMERILYNTNAQTYKAFIGGEGNFRKIINPLYKANRTRPPPNWLDACKEHLVTEWKATWQDGIEADDLLGIHQHNDSIICSIDKDLRMIPGWHFNFVKCDHSEVDSYQGMFNFYAQFLIGDTSDNIRGIEGLGPKKSEKILFGLTEEEMFNEVRSRYNDDDRMLLNGRCLWIWRKELDLWNPEQLKSIGEDHYKLVVDHLSKSMTQIKDSCMEPIIQETVG